ncbi:hypothetical protein [Sphingomonas sp. Y38-1Y]|uniref:hypothetical protein n=1 Tax=Sphingomonas sp. Y38-1Y TaxID=3078265 RepID=UPI0028E25E35|nr:hypothetical protein [Sphingomonas sp. Y38-1Y]
MRPLMILLLAMAASVSAPAHAQQNAFDLVGPTVALSVTRGGSTLSIARVPNLQAGDRLTGRADLPADKSARYLLVIGFLRGAATPPPKDWFFQTKTWQRGKKPFTVTVPEGAEQAIALLVPEAGGGFGAVVDAVRERPGAFVRASQDLYQASLDRARLEAFVAGITRIEESDPDRLDTASPVLAGSLALRLNSECLTRQRALRAACLTQSRENQVLQASSNTPSVGERLIGAPTDVAYRIAATREAGAGFYSPYIGLARDLVRLFGAFRSTPYQYLPALALGRDEALQLRLNTPPAFANPRSVLVVALPPVGPAPKPAWRAGAKGALCLARPGMVLPIENAPLLYATDYASDLSLDVQTSGGRTVQLPVTVNAERGGLRIADASAAKDILQVVGASLSGRWGFDRFDDLRFPVQSGAVAGWTPRPDADVVVGRDHPLVLKGGASACIDGVALRSAAGEAVPVDWKATGPDEITAKLPLARTSPGPLTLLVTQAGTAPVTVSLNARNEPSRLDGFALHVGDAEGILTGARLDQVTELRLGDAHFQPGAMVRGEKGEQLKLSSGDSIANVTAGTGEAVVRFGDGRTQKVRAVIAPPRPSLALISRSVEAQPQAGGFRFTLPEGTLRPDDRLTFSVRATTGSLRADDVIEVATQDGSSRARLSATSGGLQRVGADVAIASIRPAELLGSAAVGGLRFRLLRASGDGDWQPLAQVARLPFLDRLSCPTEAGPCTLTGSSLFFLGAISDEPDFTRPVVVSAGFVGSQIELPRPRGPGLYLRLRDVPTAVIQAEPQSAAATGR